MDDAGLGRRAAHVECDRVADAGRLAQAPVPITPAAGPLSSMRMQACCASPTSKSPPVDCTIKAAGEARDGEMVLHLGEVAAHARADIGVGGGGRGALELPVFLRQLVAGGDEELGVRGPMIALARRSCSGAR